MSSFLKYFFVIALLAATSCVARAGTYTMVSQTGGEYIHSALPAGAGSIPYTTTSSGYGFQQSLNGGTSISGSGTITTVFVWVRNKITVNDAIVDDPNDNPPAKVIVREVCIADAGGWAPWAQITPSVGNGLGNKANATDFYGGMGKQSVGARATSRSGQQTITVSSSPSASIASSSTSGPLYPNGPTQSNQISAGIGYNVSVSTSYASGTFVARGTALPYGFTGTLASFEVKLGGDTVHSGSTQAQLNAKTIVHFDSTHFSDGDDITGEAIATNTLGHEFKETYCQLAYNKGIIAIASEYGGNSSPEGSSVSGSFGAMNHEVLNATNAVSLEDAVRKGTALHFGGHGGSDDGGPYIDLGTDLHGSDFGYWTGGIANPSPGISIAFINACSTAAGYVPSESGDYADPTFNDMAQGILATGRGGSSTNKACVQWRIVVDGLQNPFTSLPAAQTFWARLAAGDTAHIARDKAVHASNNNVPVDDGRDYACCFGDYYATLHRLYTGNDIAPATWHD